MKAKPQFEELDFRETPLGDLSLRRRTILALENREVFEIILGEAFLMSSLFTVVEEQLAIRGLDATKGENLDVVVGGLGLGYTAINALDHPRLHQLRVIDYLSPVIEWHQSGILPLGKRLTSDKRCQLVQGDFFELAQTSFEPESPGKKYHTILLDVDHSPEKLLNPTHGNLYTEIGLTKMANQLHEKGVFALWSDDPPEPSFMERLETVFTSVQADIIEFDNPLQNTSHTSTVYLAKKT